MDAETLRAGNRYRTYLALSGEGIAYFELEEPLRVDAPEDEQVAHIVRQDRERRGRILQPVAFGAARLLEPGRWQERADEVLARLGRSLAGRGRSGRAHGGLRIRPAPVRFPWGSPGSSGGPEPGAGPPALGSGAPQVAGTRGGQRARTVGARGLTSGPFGLREPHSRTRVQPKAFATGVFTGRPANTAARATSRSLAPILERTRPR